MTDQSDNNKADDPIDVIQQLKDSGFLEQIQNLESTLKTLANDLQGLGTVATQRLEETESLAAHVLAMETLMAMVLKSVHIDEAALREEVKTRTAHLSGEADGSQAVLAIIEDILTRSRSMQINNNHMA